jgi:FkbM family methyltransferase
MGNTNPELEKKLLEIFDNKTKGFFVDIGAHDGVTINNTKFLEDLGWNGVCIEPNPIVFEKLIENRNCDCVNCAVWNEDTVVNYLSISGYSEMLSGIYESYDQRHYNRIQRELIQYGGKSEILKIEAKKFSSIVKEKNIDLISIDTEGSELQILDEIDFNEFNVKVICVENNFFEKKFDDFMDSKGYRFYTKVFIDYIYIKK